MTDLARDRPLTAAERKKIQEDLEPGQELHEGDFAEDEKWRIVTTQHPQSTVVAVALEVDPLAPAPDIGQCVVCEQPINERDGRTEDERGAFHVDCYEPPPAKAARTRTK